MTSCSRASARCSGSSATTTRSRSSTGRSKNASGRRSRSSNASGSCSGFSRRSSPHAIVSSGDESILSSHRRQVAMFFADLRGWTRFVDAVEPEELMRVLGEFHETIGGLVKRFDATVGFLEGDGVQLFFNDPIEIPDAPLRAVRLGCALREEMAERDAAVAKARPRPRLRRRHCARLCDLRRGRLRGPLRLCGDRRGHEPRLAARRRGDRRPDPDRPAPLRRGRGRRPRGARRRIHPRGLPAPGDSVQRRRRARDGDDAVRSYLVWPSRR